MSRHNLNAVICLAFIIFICIAFYVLSQNWEPWLIMDNDLVIPLPDVTIEAWLEPFKMWSAYIIAAAGLAALIWFVLGKWALPVVSWHSAGKRTIWFLLAGIPLLTTAVAYLFTPVAQEGTLYAWGFYLANGLLPYYFATALFSPPAYKYSPIGAASVWRRLW